MKKQKCVIWIQALSTLRKFWRLTKNKKVIITIKDKLGENIVKESDLIDDGKEDKKAKAQEIFVTKKNVKFKDNIDGLEEAHL